MDFGILHLIGISTILAYPLLRFKWFNLALWVALSAAGKWLEPLHFDGRWISIPLGASLRVLSGRALAGAL